MTGIHKADDRTEATAANGHVVPTAAEVQKGYHTESSQYASAESKVEAGDSIGIQRMSLGPSGLLIYYIAWKTRLIYVVVEKGSRADRYRHPYALKKMRVRLPKDNYNHI